MAIDLFRFIATVFFYPKPRQTKERRKAHIREESEDTQMVDLNEKSKEEIFREKKEAELREAKRKENEAE